MHFQKVEELVLSTKTTLEGGEIAELLPSLKRLTLHLSGSYEIAHPTLVKIIIFLENEAELLIA